MCGSLPLDPELNTVLFWTIGPAMILLGIIAALRKWGPAVLWVLTYIRPIRMAGRFGLRESE